MLRTQRNADHTQPNPALKEAVIEAHVENEKVVFILQGIRSAF